jgi:hypothetical protein
VFAAIAGLSALLMRRASEEAMRLIRALTRAGRAPVTFDGRFDQVAQVRAPPVATPPIWTGAT